MYPRKGSQGYWIWTLSDKIHKGSGGPWGIWCEQRYSTRRRKNAMGLDYRNNQLTQSSTTKEFIISKSRDQSKGSDKKWISSIDLEAQPIKALIGQEPAHIQMTSEPEGWILGSDWGLRAFATNWINRLKMIMTRDANKITRLMGLNIMQASKNFKNNRLLRIFGRSNGISKSFAKHLISGVEQILGKCEELSVGGIHVARTAWQ